MTRTSGKLKFKWTEQCQRMALLLWALGHSDRAIANALGCDGSTVGRHLGARRDRQALSSRELQDLFEQYDAQRNIEEIIIAASGSTEQARLRTSLRVRAPGIRQTSSEDADRMSEEMSDEQLRREVAALVGQDISVRDGS
ncbi:MAG: hypothetical protein AAFN91_07905 [Pseudomonadota bacterium]